MTPLPHESLLETLAEVSVGFVGFSLIASVFRSGSTEGRVRFATFRDVAEVSLLAALGSFLPLLLKALGWENERVWLWSSATLAVLFAIGGTGALYRQARLHDLLRRFLDRPFRQGFLALNMLVVLAVAMTNALFVPPSGALHVWAVGLCLSHASQLFLLATFEDLGVQVDPTG